MLGITALLGAITVDQSFYKLNWPVMMLFSIGLYYFLTNDNSLTRVEGLLLFAMLVAFLFILIKVTSIIKQETYFNVPSCEYGIFTFESVSQLRYTF